METIYTGNLGQKLFLYNSESFIYLRTSSGMDISRPILLCSDYSSGLSSVIFHDSIHFLYQNLQGDLIIRNILDSNILYRLPADKSPDYAAPLLLTFRDRLLLFYFVKNPLDETYLLKLTFPLEMTETNFSSPAFPALPKVQYLHLDDSLIFSCKLPAKYYIYQMDKDFTCSEVQFIAKTALESIKNDFENKFAKELTDYHEKLAVFNKKIEEKEKLIDSISSQYDELMNTALRYKEEAAKWYHKFYSKKNERISS